MKTLLLGMGNPILSDDAVGVRLATDFRRRLGGIPHLDVVEECSVGGLNLLDVLRGYDRAIVLDSIQTEAGVPGTWYRFELDALRDTMHLTNIHDVNFATAMALGRRIGMPLPDEVHIFAVEIEEAHTFSERMTPALERSYPRIAAAILEEVRGLLESPGGALGPLTEGTHPSPGIAPIGVAPAVVPQWAAPRSATPQRY